MTDSSTHADAPLNDLVVVAGFPKSGNTLINETLSYAGKLVEPSWEPPRYEWNNDADIARICSNTFSENPYLGAGRCHLKTHQKYSKENYNWSKAQIRMNCIVIIIRNPFDTLLSATNYLRYSATVNKALTANQIATLKHFYPGYTDSDVLGGKRFDLEKLRDEGALDNALEIFANSGTCVPQFLARSGTWLDFYQSFNQTRLPSLRIRFEDVVNSEDQWAKVAATLGTFLARDEGILAAAFKCQDQACQKAKSEHNPFFPVAESNYFFRYFEPRSLRRFCNVYQNQLASLGYEDLVDTIMST